MIEMIEVEEFNKGTHIKVIGVGGGGSNAVEHMIEKGVNGAEFICANTDAQALSSSRADRTVQLGGTGLGAGGKPEKGREAAEMAEDAIRDAIAGANMLFITAGMGGGTGTGAAPIVARIAREMGILTVGVVTKPFDFEGARRMSHADAGLAELEANVDSLIVVLNDKLLEVLGDDVTQDEAFAHANDVLRGAVGGIAEIIKVKAHMNVDFEDVRTVMSEPGKAMMGSAVASGVDRARVAAEAAVACPLLDGVDMSGARGAVVLVTASRKSLKLSESKLAMETIKAFTSPEANVIFGTAYDDSIGDDIRVTVVATGLSRQGESRKPRLEVVQRTGTDNLPYAISTSPVGYASAGSAPLSGVTLGQANAVADSAMPARAPSVWGSGRDRTHAAAKVEALASSGVEDFEIPAFLRKQAD